MKFFLLLLWGVAHASFIERYTVYLVDLKEFATARRFLWLTKEDPEALYWMGMLNIEGLWNSKKEANVLFLKAAHKGHAPSMCALGDSYFSGDGLEQNFQKAAYWYKKAAKAAYAASYFHLGVLYRDGKGVARSLKKARFYFQKAADHLPHLKNQALQLKHSLHGESS